MSRKKELCRFSISMEPELSERLDKMIADKGMSSRSQAVAKMVQASFVEHESQIGNHEIAGTVTLVYDHHKRNIQSKLTTIQHDYGNLVISAMHIHLNHNNCMEVLAVRGEADIIRKFADRLISVKGIIHGCLTVTATETDSQNQ